MIGKKMSTNKILAGWFKTWWKLRPLRSLDIVWVFLTVTFSCNLDIQCIIQDSDKWYMRWMSGEKCQTYCDLTWIHQKKLNVWRIPFHIFGKRWNTWWLFHVSNWKVNCQILQIYVWTSQNQLYSYKQKNSQVFCGMFWLSLLLLHP